MSKLDIVSCDCGCGKTSNNYNVFFSNNGWMTLKCGYDTDSEIFEYHFSSFKCLRRWTTERLLTDDR